MGRDNLVRRLFMIQMLKTQDTQLLKLIVVMLLKMCKTKERKLGNKEIVENNLVISCWPSLEGNCSTLWLGKG